VEANVVRKHCSITYNMYEYGSRSFGEVFDLVYKTKTNVHTYAFPRGADEATRVNHL